MSQLVSVTADSEAWGRAKERLVSLFEDLFKFLFCLIEFDRRKWMKILTLYFVKTELFN